jgi:sugar lactone lactonase YvrE
MKRSAVLLALVLGLAIPHVAAAQWLPAHIDLPNGFAPEGIAIGRHATFYSGSLSGAGIWRGSLRSGQGDFLVKGGGPFAGMKVDRFNRLWVAGGPSGVGYVFDAESGTLLATFDFGASPTFVNDVVITRRAAFFTESSLPQLYRVPIGPQGGIGQPDVVALDPDAIGFVPGAFNLNGIDAAGGRRRLIAVNSTTGALIQVNGDTGAARPIDLRGATVVNGDGILLQDERLYVVRNFDNVIAVVHVASDLDRGSVRRTIEPDDVDVPTTVAAFRDALYVVNARFELTPGPDVPYWVTRVER